MKIVKVVFIAVGLSLTTACDVDFPNLTDRDVDVQVMKYDQITTIAVDGNMLSIGNEHAEEIAFALLDGTRGLSFDATYTVQLEIESLARRDAVVEAITYDLVTEILDGDQSQSCVDSDGDGWGWDGTVSCLVEPSVPVVAGECIDVDGDGWGWNGVDTCFDISVVDGSSQEAVLVVVDSIEEDASPVDDSGVERDLGSLSSDIANDPSATTHLEEASESASAGSESLVSIEEAVTAGASLAGALGAATEDNVSTEAFQASINTSLEATSDSVVSFVECEYFGTNTSTNGRYMKISWAHVPEKFDSAHPELVYAVYINDVQAAVTEDNFTIFDLLERPDLASGRVELATVLPTGTSERSDPLCFDFTDELMLAIDQ